MEVKISELKAKLSAYLDQVRNGQTIIILDRKSRVAQLCPIGESSQRLPVEAASRPPADVGRVKGVRLRRPVDVDQVLRETRGDR